MKKQTLNIVEKLLADLKLEVINPKNLIFPQHEEVAKIFCRKRKEKFVLKVQLTKKPSPAFLREIWFHKIFNNKLRQSRYCRLQKLKGRGKKEGLNWLLLEFLEGEKTGNVFAFDKKFLRDKLIPHFLDFPFFVSKIGKGKRVNRILTKRNGDFFLKSIDKDKNKYVKVLGQGDYAYVLREFRRYKNLLNRYCTTLTHRDNHPANVLWGKNKKLIILDWSDASLSNFMYDFTDLWLHSWQKRSWQEKFAQSFDKKIKKEDKLEAKLFFKLNLLFLLPIEMHNLQNEKMVNWAFKGKISLSFIRQAFHTHSKNFNFAKTL